MCKSGAEREGVEDCESVHGWLVWNEAGETFLRVARRFVPKAYDDGVCVVGCHEIEHRIPTFLYP